MIEEETFGYGSLILPTSVKARYTDEIGPAKPKYEQGLEYEDEDLLRETAEQLWEQDLQEGADFIPIPVKIPGFKRNYTWEKYGATMLEAEHTGNPDDMINGVILKGLSKDQTEQINSSEDGYNIHEVPPEQIEPYIDNIEIENPVTIYTESSDERSNFMTSRTRSNTYHDRIMRGIDMLEEIHGEETINEFRDDFLNHTYETPVPGTNTETREEKSRMMNTVKQQDNALKAFNQLFSQ